MIEEIKIISLSGRGSLYMKTRECWSYWLGPVDWGQVQGQHQTYSFYNQVGGSIVGTKIGTRPLSIIGWVVDAGSNTLQERCDFLNAFISPAEDYELEFKSKKIRFRPDISVAYSPEYMKNNEKVRRFLIQGTCPFPLFSDSEASEASFEQTEKRFCFPTGFGRKAPLVFAISKEAYSVNIRSTGGFPSGIIVRIRFTGEVVNPSIHNLTTGKMDGVRRTFSSGEQLEISTTPGSKHMILWTADGEKQDLIKYRDVRTAWIQLQPGENRISISCDDLDQRSNMDVKLYYTPLYLEVE